MMQAAKAEKDGNMNEERQEIIPDKLRERVEEILCFTFLEFVRNERIINYASDFILEEVKEAILEMKRREGNEK